MIPSTTDRGREGEDLAANYLTGQGCRIIARNVRLERAEIDLIIVDGEVLVFVEVKTWRTHDAFDLARAIGPRKRRQIVRAATAWIARSQFDEPKNYRFDVLFIRPDLADYQWYRAAFDASS